jgi:predicted amidohydrolase
MFQAYASKGVQLILVVAEWPQLRIEHWRHLLRSRAIENQCFVAGVNKSGESQGELLGGFSAVIDPMGNYLVEGDEREQLLFATLDLQEVEQVQKQIPVLKNRKTEVYQAFLNENY